MDKINRNKEAKQEKTNLIVDLEKVPNRTYKFSFKFLGTIIVGIISMVSFIFFQYYQIKSEIRENQYEIKSLEKDIATFKENKEEILRESGERKVLRETLSCDEIKKKILTFELASHENKCE